MRGVDRRADQVAVGVGAHRRGGQIGSGGSGPLERMLVDVAAVHRALQHAVADTRFGQLHDHVGRRQQHRGGIQQVDDPGGPPGGRLIRASRPLVRRCRGGIGISRAGRRAAARLPRRPGVRRSAPVPPGGGFGTAASGLEQVTYRDGATAGVAACRDAAGGAGCGDDGGRAGRRAARAGVVGARRRPPRRGCRWAARRWRAPGGRWPICSTPATSTGRERCCRRCVDAIRRSLDADGLARAALESVAENTSDAQVAPLLWAARRRGAGRAGVPRRSTPWTR